MKDDEVKPIKNELQGSQFEEMQDLIHDTISKLDALAQSQPDMGASARSEGQQSEPDLHCSLYKTFHSLILEINSG